MHTPHFDLPARALIRHRRHRAAVAAAVVALGLSWLGTATRADNNHLRELRDPQAALLSADGRLMRYLVSCAMPAGMTVRNPGTVDAGGDFQGAMGLTPAWAHRALEPREQRLLSACLLARTNALGVPVLLSMRSLHAGGPPTLRATNAEKRRFPRLEAAFFGNLFAPVPVAYFCTGDAAPDRTEWLRRQHRLCSLTDPESGASTCGFVDVGRCSAASLTQGGVHYTNEAVAVFLPGS